jgi:signal transduction histidine kinase
MLRFRNTSIRQRLTLIIMGISCITVIVTTVAISAIGVVSLKESIRADLGVSATIMGDRNRAALTFGKQEQASNNLSVLGVKPPIVQACLYDSDGNEFASYVNTQYRGEVRCPRNFKPRTAVNKERIEVMKAIEGDFGVSGYIYLESTLEQVDEYVEKQTSIGFTVAMGAFLLSYLLAVNLQKAISQPVLHLASVARHVSEHKDYSVRAKQAGNPEKEQNNELVVLTDSFNNMLSEIGARDTQLKAQNTELERARDEAESSNRAKSQFLANISHELRTPLNAIIGFSSILMNQLFGTLGDVKYLEYAKDINESGTHLLDIINDILDLSKAEAGKLALAYEEVHVAKAIQKCVTIMTERAEKTEVKIATNVPKSLPPLVVDRLRFIQIVLNVLSNAVKFSHQGGLVEIVVEMDDTKHFLIHIHDSGIGMSQEDIDKAFQSFGQVDSGLNRKYEGAGLGLPLTKKLLELHHGGIGIKSEVGKGTTVTLTLPATPPEGFMVEAEQA